MYRKEEGGSLLLVAVYVDDLFVTGICMKAINEFNGEMETKFEMRDLGRLTYYLRIEVTTQWRDNATSKSVRIEDLRISRYERM